MEMKKLIRTAQTYAGPLLEIKAWTQRTMRSTLRRPSEPCYRSFRDFPFEPEAQFLDVGANRGQTISSMRLYRPNQRIIAFEPNPVLAQRLLNWNLRNGSQLTVHPFGLGAESGSFELFVPYYRDFMFDGLASFDFDSAHDWLQTRIYGYRERHLRIEKIRCEIRKWDEVATRPGLVKIDVQGFESSVLAGGIDTIQTHRPVFLIENDPARRHEVILFGQGYERASFERGHMLVGRDGIENTYYIPKEKLRSILSAYRR